MAKKKKKGSRKYSSAADRAKSAAAQAGPNSGGALFKLPDGMERYKPEEGKVILRFLPYVVTDPKHPDGDAAPEDDIWYKRPWKRIRSIGVENNSFVSPRSFGRPCPISEYYTTAKADPSIPEKEVNKLKTQDCVMYNVQEIDRKGNASDVMFFSFSYHNFEKQLKKELMDPDNEEYTAFMDLEGGFDVKIRWEEDSFGGHKFMYADKISFVERDDDLDEDILDEVVNLDEVLIEKSYEELNNIFLEIDGDDDDDKPEKKKGKGKKSSDKKGKSKKKKDEPELELDELVDMSKSKMKKFIKKHDLDVDVDQDEEDIRMDLAQEFDLDLPNPDGDDDPECPHGLDFGDDFDEKKKCKKCKLRDECEEANEGGEPGGGDDDPPKCPHGLDFGEDFDSKKKCKKCKLRDDCEEASEPPPEKKKGKGKKKGKKGQDDECPHGHEWAVDCDEEKDCETCDKWDDCVEAQEALKK